jgi:cation transport ATPase
MVRIIPFVLEGTSPTKSIVKSNTAQFWIWTILNTIAAVLSGVSYYFGHISSHYKTDKISLMIITLLCIISAIYLGMSIYRIRKLTKKKEIHINTKIMIVHSSTVIIYLLSLIGVIFTFFDNYGSNHFYVAEILSNFCNYTTQLMICYIFWNMDNIQFVPMPNAVQNS